MYARREQVLGRKAVERHCYIHICLALVPTEAIALAAHRQLSHVVSHLMEYCGLGRLLRCKAQRQRLSMHARLYTCQHHLAYPKSQKAPAHGAGSCSYVLEQESGASSVAVARIIRPVSRFCAVWEVWWRAEEADSRLGCRKRSPLV